MVIIKKVFFQSRIFFQQMTSPFFFIHFSFNNSIETVVLFHSQFILFSRILFRSNIQILKPISDDCTVYSLYPFQIYRAVVQFDYKLYKRSWKLKKVKEKPFFFSF